MNIFIPSRLLSITVLFCFSALNWSFARGLGINGQNDVALTYRTENQQKQFNEKHFAIAFIINNCFWITQNCWVSEQL